MRFICNITVGVGDRRSYADKKSASSESSKPIIKTEMMLSQAFEMVTRELSAVKETMIACAKDNPDEFKDCTTWKKEFNDALSVISSYNPTAIGFSETAPNVSVYEHA